jgi:hypothetical protein
MGRGAPLDLTGAAEIWDIGTTLWWVDPVLPPQRQTDPHLLLLFLV